MNTAKMALHLCLLFLLTMIRLKCIMRIFVLYVAVALLNVTGEFQ